MYTEEEIKNLDNTRLENELRWYKRGACGREAAIYRDALQAEYDKRLTIRRKEQISNFDDKTLEDELGWFQMKGPCGADAKYYRDELVIEAEKRRAIRETLNV